MQQKKWIVYWFNRYILVPIVRVRFVLFFINIYVCFEFDPKL